jgi:hypothetical protein
MKKIFFGIVFCCFALSAFPQFVSGLGFFIAGQGSRHKYTDSNDPERYGSHKGKLLFRPAGGIVGDFFPGSVKWRTEFEYNMMGSKEIVVEENGKTKYKNKMDYISWNNFIKIHKELYSGFPYLLVGGRVQYLFKNKPQVYETLLNDAKRFHYSWDVAAGFEFMAYGSARIFTEYHFLSDIPSLYKNDGMKIRSITHELRIGLMFRFHDKRESCNAPIYNDPY